MYSAKVFCRHWRRDYPSMVKQLECDLPELLHLPEIQPGMENPHPPRFYISGLTSPSGAQAAFL